MEDVYVEFISSLLAASRRSDSAEFAMQYANGVEWAVDLRKRLVDLAGDISNQVADSVEIVTAVKQDLIGNASAKPPPREYTSEFTLDLDDEEPLDVNIINSSQRAVRTNRLFAKLSLADSVDSSQVDALRRFAESQYADDDDDGPIDLFNPGGKSRMENVD
jgi:hypothetical protein